MTITFVSIVIALLVGGIEGLGVIGGQLGLTSGFWAVIGALNENFGAIGYLIIGIFVFSWIVSFAIYRVKGYDRIEVPGRLTMRQDVEPIANLLLSSKDTFLFQVSAERRTPSLRGFVST